MAGASTLDALRFTLESNDILEWKFDFWEVEDKQHVRKKLARVNNFRAVVHVIRAVEEGTDANKRQLRIEEVSSILATEEVDVFVKPEVQFVEIDEEEPEALLVGKSRVSGNSDELEKNRLQSKLIPNEVMDRCFKRAKRLRAELKRVAMEDHEWWLKTFDLNGSGVVKVWCVECKKDCGGDSKDHNKSRIDNLFNNFRRSHILSTTHVRNYYAAKKVNFEDYP